MRILFILLILFQCRVYAVTDAPVVLRACLNNADSTVTLSWTGITDACGSFSKYSIYGNNNGGVYSKVTDIADINIKEHSFKIPDLNSNRKYYISVLYLCDLADSVISNNVTIDISMNESTVLDSVSFDVNTQQIIAGWKSNGESDLMGYRLFRYSGGVNDSLGETADTFYTVSPGLSDVFDVTIAAFDSCTTFSMISGSHRPAILSTSIDTCLNEISLNWSRYRGWVNIDSQQVIVQRNGADFQRFTSLPGADNSFIFTNFALGDTLCFLIRSYTEQGTISSSSNISCIETRERYIPTYTYMKQVTVENDEYIAARWSISGTEDLKEFNIYRSIDASNYSSLGNLAIVQGQLDYEFLDNNTDVEQSSYSYYVSPTNVCDQEVDSSNQAKSILLKLDNSLQFNTYSQWDGGVSNYDIEWSELNSSTWNLLQTQVNNASVNITDSSLCYRVRAIENINSYGYAESSTSNAVCIEPSLKVFMPNTMVLSGKNNRFLILGEGIDHQNSYYEIYNRWGEMLVQFNTDRAWYGEYKGDPVLPGVYVYVVKVMGIKGESASYKGVLRIIE